MHHLQLKLANSEDAILIKNGILLYWFCVQAWHLWNENKAMELVDPSIGDSCSPNEVLKCIHIGLLCVQDSATHRPTMASLVLMLESENPTLPMPRKPTYTSMRSSIDAEFLMDGQEIVSSNDVTVTMVLGR